MKAFCGIILEREIIIREYEIKKKREGEGGGGEEGNIFGRYFQLVSQSGEPTKSRPCEKQPG